MSQERRIKALLDGVLAQACADRHVLDNINRCRQGSDPQDNGQICCLFMAETAGYLG